MISEKDFLDKLHDIGLALEPEAETSREALEELSLVTETLYSLVGCSNCKDYYTKRASKRWTTTCGPCKKHSNWSK